MRNEPEKSFGMKQSFDLSYALTSVHSLGITPFLRDGFGSHALGLPAVFAAALIIFIGVVTQSPGMTIYFLLWLFAVVIQKCRTAGARRNGHIEHSRYSGWPIVAMRFPFVRREYIAKRWIEPLICLAVGRLIYFVSPAVGGFIMAGFISIAVKTGIEGMIWRARGRILRDAQIEQQQLAQMLQESNDEF